MYISINWIKRHLPDFELHNIQHLKEKLDTRLSEVENIEQKGEQLSNLIIGRIEKVVEHPTNKKLFVCTVDVEGPEPLTIVCGAPNAKEGIISVVCLPGGSVVTADGTKMAITERKMGDVTSQGMLCAPDELGMSDDHSKIIELPSNSKIGMDVTDMFSDIVIEIENKALPHRPDAFSHLGIAREFKAIFKLQIANTDPDSKLKMSAERTPEKLSIEIKNTELCPRFSAVVLDEVKVEPSPLWMQIALSYAGVRPISNIVDATNYVMLDIGQPMHAFDYAKLESKKLIIREAKDGETVTTLDDKERELEDGMMVVATPEGVESIAGIMGGAKSEISSSTTKIVLEAANWEMYQIRRTSRKLGLRSEASARYEKGISPETTIQSLQRAFSLIQDMSGADVASDILDEYPVPDAPRSVEIDLGAIRRFIGVDIEKTKVVDSLSWLGLGVEGMEKIPADAIHRPEITTLVEIKIPHYRRDLNNPEDILEEVSRMYGYENIPLTLPTRNLKPARKSAHTRTARTVRNIMTGIGLNEIYTYSMVGEQLYSDAFLKVKELISIPAPISPELAYVRNQLLPSILSKVKVNSGKLDKFGLFELSRVAVMGINSRILPDQPFKLAWVVVEEDQENAYRKAKLGIEAIAEQLHGQLKVTKRTKKNQFPFLHPGQTGDVVLGKTKIGEIGNIHPMVLDNFDISNLHVAAAEIDFAQLVEMEEATIVAEGVSNFPATKRDISYWLGADSDIGGFIDDSILKFVDIVDIKLIDTYENKETGQRSITLRYVIQSAEYTLEQEELQDIESQLRADSEHFGLSPRD